jgi:hypothetical protein
MRRNNPYFGYVPPDNTLDWAKLTGGLVDTITGISEERQKQREELDKINIENQKIVSTVDRYADPTLDQFVLSASEQGRSVMTTWNTQLKNREIKPAEYRNRMNNLMTNWAQFGTATKTFNSRIQEALKRSELNEDGESVASGYELYKIKQLAEYGNLKNKKAFIDPQTGNIMSGVLNEQTGLVDPSTLVTGAALNNPENLQANKVNVNKLVSNSVKNWEPYILESGTITTGGKGMNPFLAKAMSTLTASIMTTPEAIASILDDNQAEYEIEYWTTQDEKKSVINKMISEQNAARQKMGQDPMTEDESNKYIEDNSWTMIQNSRDGNGVMRPLITKDQSDRAKEIIENNINAQIGKKVIEDEPLKPTTTPKPPAGDKPTDAQTSAKTKGFEIQQIMSGGFSELEIEQKLKVASGNQFTFKYKKATNTYDAIKIGAKKPSFTGLKTASDMYKIFSTGAQEQYYKQGTKSKSKTQQKQTFD